ncbi:hypothetical protein CAP35_11600 [Chitinophagaceae bacterium IBVUCB1]|nr:hypothetical protein CAP35_11600 [Chitinophagaceae bacterium IBVUCB1]
MRIKVLMVSNQQGLPVSDAEMLKERGFMVYTCTDSLLHEMVDEVHPDIIFINPEEPDAGTTKAYHSILKDKELADLPVIYTVSEDDVYLITPSRMQGRKNKIISDNIIDGIKVSLQEASHVLHHLPAARNHAA